MVKESCRRFGWCRSRSRCLSRCRVGVGDLVGVGSE